MPTLDQSLTLIKRGAVEILPEEARKYDSSATVGDKVEIALDTKQFGRIAAQTAKHVIRQGIREAERGQLFAEYSSRQPEQTRHRRG